MARRKLPLASGGFWNKASYQEHLGRTVLSWDQHTHYLSAFRWKRRQLSVSLPGIGERTKSVNSDWNFSNFKLLDLFLERHRKLKNRHPKDQRSASRPAILPAFSLIQLIVLA